MKKIKAVFNPCSLTSLGDTERADSFIRSSLVKISFFALLMTVIFISPLLALAQTTPASDTTNPQSGIFNCFEQYKFNSVSIEPLYAVSNARAGSDFSVPLLVTNTNNYPIVNGAVYVKILKNDDSTGSFLKGPAVVEQTYLVKNLTLAAKESKQVDFTWGVPLSLTAGKYSLATYFVADEKFNYSGLSFTNDVVGGLIEFNLDSENTQSAYINKDNIKVNGENYDPAGFSSKVGRNESVSVQIEIVNNTKEVVRYPVTWYVYTWDGLSQSNGLFTKDDGVFLNPGEKKTLELLVPDNKNPVYYVTAVGEYEDSRSFVDIRYARNEITSARINSASVSVYPLKAGEQAQVYACFHSMSDQTVPNTKLVVALKDDQGNTVASSTYAGGIGPDVTGLRQVFTPNKDLYNFSVESNLYRDNKLIDSDTIKYVCSDLQKTGCPVVSPESTSPNFINSLLTSPYINYIYGLIGVLLLLLLIIVIQKIRK